MAATVKIHIQLNETHLNVRNRILYVLYAGFHDFTDLLQSLEGPHGRNGISLSRWRMQSGQYERHEE